MLIIEWIYTKTTIKKNKINFRENKAVLNQIINWTKYKN